MGGTFTDGYFDDGRDVVTCKVPTLRFDLTTSLLHCLREGAERYGERLDTFLDRVALIRLATTVGTNAVIEGSGSRVGLLVDEGQERDIYDAASEPELFANFLDQAHVRGWEATVDEEALLRRCAELVHEGVRQVVVSLGPGEERAERDVERMILERYPEHYLRSVPMQLSGDVTAVGDPRVRTNTAVVNAYLHRDMAALLHRAEQELRVDGLGVPLLIVHANSGVSRVAKTTAISTYSSGPSAGLSGVEEVSSRYEDPYVLTADMGGTTLDLGFVRNGRCETETRPQIAGVPVALSMNRTDSRGIAGCSIATFEDGRVTLGPESAGAVPGPAAYGRGGKRPTLTDADILVGLLEEGSVLGGQFVLDASAARAALEASADVSFASAEAAAAAIETVAAESIAAAFDETLSARSLDPTDAVLYVFGGAGPLHVWKAAQLLGVGCIRSFPFGSAFSAFGCTVVDVRHRYEIPWRNGPLNTEAVTTSVASVLSRGIADLIGEGFDPMIATARASAYQHDGARVGGEVDVAKITRHEAAQSLIAGLSSETAGRDLDLIVIEVSAELARERARGSAFSDPSRGGGAREREVRWDGEAVATPVLPWVDMPRDWISGPILLEHADSTHAIGPGWKVRMDELGNAEWRPA